MLFYPDRSASVNGIISFLRSVNKSSEYEAITNSENPNYLKENVLDISTPSFWGSKRTEDDIWIGVSFINYNIKVTHYTIRQYTGDGHMFQSWIFQGLKCSDNTWENLDTKSSPDYCKEGTVLDTFSIQEE